MCCVRHLGQARRAVRQGVGRLLRRDTDRGVMTILDSRVTHKGWGAQILSALPESARHAHDLANVADFFGLPAGPTETWVA
jgi:ATP-dependent DNA helicase DinG